MPAVHSHGLWERRRTGALVLGVCFAVLVWRSVGFDFLSDDAFITFRYAKNFLAGEGLVFNPGQRVEGYTNLLHLLLVAGISTLGIDLVTAGRSVGIVSALLLVALSGTLAAQLVPARRWLWGGFAAILLAINPYLAIWSLGGLETTLYSLLVMGAVSATLVKRPTGKLFFLASILAVAAALTRPEGVVVYPLIVAIFVLRKEGSAAARLRCMAPGIMVWVAILGASEALRYIYYGAWLPNTFHAKGGFTGNHVARGLRYIGLFSMNIWIAPSAILATAGIVFAGDRGRHLGALLLLLATVVVSLGGDGLPAYRFMIPLLAPLFVLAALGAEALFRTYRPAWPRTVLVLTPVVAALLLGTGWHVQKDTQYQLYRDHLQEVPKWSLVGRWLKFAMPPETAVALVPIGAVGYFSELPVIDMVGLTDPHIARRKMPDLGDGWAGHEKSDGAYVINRSPTLFLLGNVLVFPSPLAEMKYFFPPNMPSSVFRRERDVLTDPSFVRFYRPVAIQMQEGTYLNCFVRK